jgi:hypothetical protein
VQPDPYGEADATILDQRAAEIADRRHQGQSRLDRPPRVIFMRLWPAKVDQKPLLSGVGFFREVFITVKRFGKRAILLLG